MEFSNLYIVIGKKSENGGRSLYFADCSRHHQLMIPTLTMSFGQGRKLTGFILEECKGEKTMYNLLKSFDGNGYCCSLNGILQLQLVYEVYSTDFQVRYNLEQAKTLVEVLIKREEKKRDAMENEVSLQRMQMKYKHEAILLEDLALPALPSFPSNVGSSEEDFDDSDDVANSRLHVWPAMVQNSPFVDPKLLTTPPVNLRRKFRGRHAPHGWLHKLDSDEPVLMFTQPLDPAKLAATGIMPPSYPPKSNDTSTCPLSFRGRIGRGGRIVFDRWNPLMHTPIDCGDAMNILPKRHHA